MQPPSEITPLCTLCHKHRAIQRYTRGGFDEMLCASCLDRMAVQDASEDQLLHRLDLARRGQYDEALACLDAIWEANRHRDHTGWLARSVASERAHILYEAGRYEEALQACEAWALLGFENVTDRWFVGSTKASILQAIGRHREALEAFEEAFSHQDSRYASGIPYYLPRLVELSEKVGQPVDEKWRRVAEAGAEDFAVELPVRDSLGESMRALAAMTQGMPSKREREWKARQSGGDGGDAP
ncbi:hypothetical protein [Polyangium mundeleinium]|uniref:Tetratricopeptide repeat protein n=1 Tax=Polyangium mundeleinium TaxID=2995306 RepID=A0ABT5EV61_9BACT|nr:hypothetical protein [Polyangium mundeleinium]MDC0744670.1 hypothetical protein [Polyangium mundeleinium]